MIPLVESRKRDAKKFKLTFDDDEDDSDDNETIELDFKKELSAYSKMAVIQQNVLDFWREHQFDFPILYCIATMILSTTATGVPSERLFPDCGNNLYDKRNRMTAECSQMLMFLYENLEFFELISD